MADDLFLSSLRPAQKRRARKRVGRGLGSGKGRYSGRGIKGQKARAGSHKMPAGFEGGQMPAHMRTGKQRGPHSKDALPVGPFRTFTIALNVRDLDRFDDGAEVTPESLAGAGLIKNTRTDVKILGEGELTKKLSVTVHRASKTARSKIEQAGGSIVVLRDEEPRKRRRGKRRRAGAASAGKAAAPAEQTSRTEEAPPEREEAPAEGASESV
jgi:large subunit ribosomal protein L15